MRKLLFVVAAIVAVSFASCTGTTATTGDNDSIDTLVDSTVVDSVADSIDSIAF